MDALSKGIRHWFSARPTGTRAHASLALLAAVAAALILSCTFAHQHAFAKDVGNDVGDLMATTLYVENPEGTERPQAVTVVPLHRMYNASTGEHFYTASSDEKNNLESIGWFYEGVGWRAPVTSETPVLRLYNPVAGDHHYTTSADERDELVANGWNYEGIGWYSDDAQALPVLRQYNPGAWSGAHNFSCDAAEGASLVNVGWRDEGTAWYACDHGWKGRTKYLTKNHLLALANNVASADWVTLGYNTDIDPGKLARVNSLLGGGTPLAFIAINARTGKVCAYRPDMRLYSASAIKAPFLAALCKYNVPDLYAWVGAMQAIIQWSSNEDFNAMVARYGIFFQDVFAGESNVVLNHSYGGAYVDITPRELVKLWITMREYILSSDANAGLFRSLFNRGYLKEGWMYNGSSMGQIYNIGGVEGDVAYAIISRYIYEDSHIWALRSAIIDAVS